MGFCVWRCGRRRQRAVEAGKEGDYPQETGAKRPRADAGVHGSLGDGPLLLAAVRPAVGRGRWSEGWLWSVSFGHGSGVGD